MDKVGLAIHGYSMEELPENTLKQRRWAMFRLLDGTIARLPADPYSLQLYLKKGFILVNEANSLGEVVPAEPKREYKHTRKFLKKQAQGKSKKEETK